MSESAGRPGSRPTRFLPLAGVGAAALWFGGTQVFISAGSEELLTPEEILVHYQTNSEVISNSIWAMMLGSALFLVFLVCLSSRIGSEEGEGGPLAPLTFAAGIILAVSQYAALATDFDAALDSVKYPLQASTAEAYFYLGDAWFVGGALMAGVLLAATGFAILRTRLIPRTIGWISLIVAIPLFIPPVSWIGMFFVVPVWLVLVAVLLARSPARVPTPDS